MEMTAPKIYSDFGDSHRKVTVLGSTGSIGCNTLDLIGRNPSAFSVGAITGNKNIELLAAQAKKFFPEMAVIGDEAGYQDLKNLLAGSGVEVAAGSDALIEAADRPSDIVMAGIVGIAGLAPTLAAARRGAIVALANKECLVCGGDMLLEQVDQNNATLLPVDSEHNAIFQVFDFNQSEKVDRLILTASGGPFRETDITAMAKVTPAEAVAHPNWDMGAKISIDSATMMNKGLELIEAYYLFPVDEKQIEILVHPQSVVHSLVSYIDGSVLAQMGTPDMRTPISYALAWPHRMATPAKRLELEKNSELVFKTPDYNKFPALTIARDALKAGRGAPIILNAANEVAVQCFLEEKIGFLDITKVTEMVLNRLSQSTRQNSPATIEEIGEIDIRARGEAEEVARSLHAK